ncbi:MAG: flippase-like domain-containing protein, partial [Thermoplasmata archaeon]|nr:flippase-like domain-containing protein [Thermoplasmata archaeon]
MNTKKIKYAKNFLPFIGLSLLIYIIYKVGINKIATSIAGINPLYLLFSFLIFIPRIFMSTYKWQVISKKQGINVDLIPMIKINLIGLFYGTITPLWIGDAIRIFYLKEKSNESLGKCVSNYTIDQIITLLSLFILAMIGSIIVMNSFPYLILTIFLIFIALLSTIIILKNEKRGKKLFNIIYNFFLPDKFKD